MYIFKMFCKNQFPQKTYAKSFNNKYKKKLIIWHELRYEKT